MPSNSTVPRRVLDLIDADECAKLALDLVNVKSPRGFEAQVGDFIYEWMNSNGIPAMKQEVVAGRSNVIGKLVGSGSGLSLTFNSHMDTGYGLPEDEWILPQPRKSFTEGWADKDRLIGLDVINDKGPMAAFLTAGKAIKESGARPKGDITLMCVAGEIGQAPIDEFQGSRYEGKGLGTRHAIAHGVVSDYALVAEGTNFAISRAEAGDVWFKVTIHAKGGVYTPFIERPFKFEDNPNAIVKAAPVVTAIEEWAYEYQEKHKYDFEDATVIPKVNIGAARGGLPMRPTQTPGVFSLYVDVRLAPGEQPGEAREELKRVIERCKVEFEIEEYLYRAGYVGRNVEKLIDSIKLAQKSVLGREPGKVEDKYASCWNDVNLFNGAGIPSVRYGPPSFNYKSLSGSAELSMKKKDLADAAKIFAVTALDLCNQER